MTRKLVNEFGAPLNRQEQKRAFPSPHAIAAGSPEILKEQVRVGYRAPAIHRLAARVAEGELDLFLLAEDGAADLFSQGSEDALQLEIVLSQHAGGKSRIILHDRAPVDSFPALFSGVIILNSSQL